MLPHLFLSGRKKALFVLVGFSLVFWVGCSLESDDGETCVILSTCESQPPATATLSLRVSPGHQNIEVRRGKNFETGSLVYRGNDNRDLELPLDDYAARVLYVNGRDTILAFDGGALSYTHSTECDEECYAPDDLTLDLSLMPGVWANR